MFVLMTPDELSPEVRKRLHDEFVEKTGEECLVLDHGIQITNISVKNDSATGGNQ